MLEPPRETSTRTLQLEDSCLELEVDQWVQIAAASVVNCNISLGRCVRMEWCYMPP